MRLNNLLSITLVILTISGSTFGAFGASTLTLEAAINEASKQSPEIAQARDRAQSASWAKTEALSAYLPHVTAGAEYLFDTKYTELAVVFGPSQINFPAGVPQTTLHIDASLLLFDGFESWNRYKAATLGSEAADLDLARAQFSLAQKIKIQFHKALASQTLLDVAEQNIKSLQDHLALAEARTRSGYMTRFDTLRVEALLEEAQAESILAKDNVINQRKLLSQMMGLAADERPLQGTIPEPSEKAITSDLALNPATREDIKSQMKRAEASEHLDSAAARHWWPKVSLFGQELWYKFGNFDPAILPTPDLKNAYSVGVRLSWDLFDGGNSIAKSEIAALAHDESNQQVKKELIRAPDEFDYWKRRFRYNVALYKARKRSVEKSEESVRLAKVGVKAGTRTSTEFLDSELELFRAKAGVVQAQADAEEALLNLELTLGHSI